VNRPEQFDSGGPSGVYTVKAEDLHLEDMWRGHVRFQLELRQRLMLNRVQTVAHKRTSFL